MKAIIIDDHTLFVDVIRALLERMGFEVVAVARSAHEALALPLGEADLVLVDVGLPDQSGLVLGRQIRALAPKSKLLVVTALNDHPLVEEAQRAGFDGYLSKDTPVTQFAAAVQAVFEGRSVFPNGAPVHRNSASYVDLLAEQLTKREREVLALLVEGLGGDAIASRLGVSGNTVRTHVQNILSKLQVHSRLEAATFAVRHGVVSVRAG
ncbi:MAG: response regulator [Actinomycetota bacterium]